MTPADDTQPKRLAVVADYDDLAGGALPDDAWLPGSYASDGNRAKRPKRRVLGMADDIDGLHQIMRKRADELNIARETIDELSGVPNGYSSKVLAKFPSKRIGASSVGPLLGALGLTLVVIEDPERIARLSSRMAARDKGQVRKRVVRRQDVIGDFVRKQARKGGRALNRKLSTEQRQQYGREGGQARARKMTAEQRSKSAKKAAHAMWEKRRKKARVVPVES